jgi:PAS domain S-box-containing protein
VDRASPLASDPRNVELALDASAIGVFDFDAVSGAQRCSPRCREIWGLPPDCEPRPEVVLSLLHADDRAAAEAAAARALDPGGTGAYAVEYRVIRRPSGEVRWVRATGQARFVDRRGVRLVGTVEDITDAKVSEERLRRSADTFYRLVENNPFGIYVVDGGFSLRHVSKGAQKVFSNVRPLIGRDFADVLRTIWPEPFASEAIARFRHTLATGEPYSAPSTVERRRDIDELEAYDWRIERIGLPNGDYGVVCYYYDLTEREQLVAELRAAQATIERQNAELREADRRKDEFLATLSHELRNPLAPIRTATEILADPALSARQYGWAHGVIQRQVKHMALLLDDLLDVARITQGKVELKKARVALTEVVDAAVESARPLIDGKHHRLTISLPAEPPTLEVDPLRLAQILSNLLTNAAKYTDAGGNIALSAQLDADELRLTVSDDGIGLPPEALDRIFVMFSQVERNGARGEGGLGIGLALVRGLVELHGGRVEARSEGRGRGSTFVVHLPLRTADPPRHEKRADESAQTQRRARRILVVDDNRDAADTLTMLLGSSGHEVRAAYGGAAALALATAFRPEIGLLDIGMPDVDGYAVARQLRAQPWADRLLLIALTGWGQDADRRHAEAVGFDHHLTKPVDPERVEAIIQTAFRGSA